MAEYDKFVLFGTVYASSDAADMDYEAVKSLYYDWRLIDNFDAAIITKRDDGKVKILRKHEQPTRKGGWRGAGWGLATERSSRCSPPPRSAAGCWPRRAGPV